MPPKLKKDVKKFGGFKENLYLCTRLTEKRKGQGRLAQLV